MTKRKIVQAAIKQYSIYNYHGATMKKIADEVGIKPASIYFFYENKEVLFFSAFQKIVEDHFMQMKSILNDVHDKPILEICSSLITGSVNYHKQHKEETNAYISLVNSPPKEIKPFLHSHMQKFDQWLIESLTSYIKRDVPEISADQASTITKQVTLLMDGIFWEINLYHEEELQDQINQALAIIELLLKNAKEK